MGVCTGGAADEGVALPFDGTFGVGVSTGAIGLGIAVGVSGSGVAATSVEHGVLEYTGLPVGAPGAGVNAGALLGSNVSDAGTFKVEQGVLEYTGFPVGAPGAGVNAGALLGSNVGDAGAWGVEHGVLVYMASFVVGAGTSGTGVRAGWSPPTCIGVGVGVTIGATELIGSIVAPGATSSKLGRAVSSSNGTRGKTRAEAALARSDRMNVECNMLPKDLIYRIGMKKNDQRTKRMWDPTRDEEQPEDIVKRRISLDVRTSEGI